MNLQYIALCLTHMRYPVKYLMLLLPLPNYVKPMTSFPIRISVDRIIAHILYFYREFTSLPRLRSKFKSMKDKVNGGSILYQNAERRIKYGHASIYEILLF